VDAFNTIIRRAQQGDMRAFQSLVEFHQQYVYAAALRIVRDEDTARDVTQECFIRVWQHLSSFDLQKKFTTWLYKITANLCRDELRRAFHSKRVHTELESLDLTTAHASTEYENTELVQKIEKIAKQLKRRQYLVFVMRDLQDFELKEIAEIVGISVGAVKSNLYYARKNIHTMLQQKGIEYEMS